MRKIMVGLIIILVVSLSTICVCYAGDVPEALLFTDSAQLYFGKVTESTETSITVLPVKKIKGDVDMSTPISYTKGLHGKAKVGETYLFGYVDENNLYYWTTDSTDPKTLKVDYQNGMNLRLQNYLNNGDFARAEEARQKKIIETVAPSSSPTAKPSPSLMKTVLPSPENLDSSLPISAEASKKPASSLLPIIMLSLIATLIVLAAIAMLVIGRRTGKR